jgi:DNA-binding winged helix-turn-helix (wHTH) protein
MSGWQANPVAYGLRRNGERIRLARQPMDLLLLLLERPQELVSRDEIATRLWAKDVFVDLDAGIHTAVLRIRQALGDSSELPQFVETVAGKGYRFVAAIDVVPSSRRHTSHALPAASDTRRHNLPTDLTSFIGRDKEFLHLSRPIRPSAPLTGRQGRSHAFASVSMAFRWRSSWPQHAWPYWHRSKSRRGSTTGSACSPEAREPPSRGSARSRPPWTGERGDDEEAASRALEPREAADASGEAWQHGGPPLTLANIALSNGEHERAPQARVRAPRMSAWSCPPMRGRRRRLRVRTTASHPDLHYYVERPDRISTSRRRRRAPGGLFADRTRPRAPAIRVSAPRSD